VLTGGAYTASAATLSGGSASIIVPAGALAVGSDTLSVAYTPDANGATSYSSATGSNTVTVTAATKTNPGLAWTAPAAITYGTALGAAQLDATASVPGAFVYTPIAGTVLPAGPQTLSVAFTPTDTATYATASSIVNITVNKATPSVTWPAPAAITYPTALGGAQLDATASTLGTFAYSPSAGVVLTAGQKTLAVAFTPTDATDYTQAAGSTTLTINKATPSITWPTPAAVNTGTALTGAQLNATSNVPGAFVYTPAAGTVMSTAGNVTLSVAFTPTDATDYNIASASVVLAVNAVVNPSFTVGGTSVNVAAGATTSNTSTITITPSGGFTGPVMLSAVISQSPTGAQFPPTLSFGSSNQVSVSGAGAVTATLTVTTTAPTVGANIMPARPGSNWRAAGGAALACVLLFWLPVRRRKLRNLFGVVALFIAFACGVAACGGGSISSGGGGGGSKGTPGTTAGPYTITITATSVSGAPTTTVSLKVS
jgi:hypothetical protein